MTNPAYTQRQKVISGINLAIFFLMIIGLMGLVIRYSSAPEVMVAVIALVAAFLGFLVGPKRIRHLLFRFADELVTLIIALVLFLAVWVILLIDFRQPGFLVRLPPTANPSATPFEVTLTPPVEPTFTVPAATLPPITPSPSPSTPVQGVIVVERNFGEIHLCMGATSSPLSMDNLSLVLGRYQERYRLTDYFSGPLGVAGTPPCICLQRRTVAQPTLCAAQPDTTSQVVESANDWLNSDLSIQRGEDVVCSLSAGDEQGVCSL
jgi:hypothetical protein